MSPLRLALLALPLLPARFAETQVAAEAIQSLWQKKFRNGYAAFRDGRPDFSLLQRHGPGSDPATVRFVAFDLLALGGRDLRARPQSERRAALEAALAEDARNAEVGEVRYATSTTALGVTHGVASVWNVYAPPSALEEKVDDVSVGTAHACAFRRGADHVWCWGGDAAASFSGGAVGGAGSAEATGVSSGS